MQINLLRSGALILLVLWGAFFPSVSARASHAAGGEITFRHIRDSTYRFTYKFYRDCAGVAAPDMVALCATNTCNGVVFSVGLQLLDTLPDGRKNGSVVNPGCPGFPTNCRGGTLMGFEEWWFEADFTMPSRCSKWVFGVQEWGRNIAATNIETSAMPPMYLEAIINNEDVQDNSSPAFTVGPVPYVCVNTLFNYSNGAWDRDGDSMAFSIVMPQTSGMACPLIPRPLDFTSPAFNLVDNPFSTGNTFQISPLTGQLSFIPDIVQNAVITVLVREYRHGKLISAVMRDIQIVVMPCNQPPPGYTLDTAGITGGRSLEQGVYTCVGNTFKTCFSFKAPYSNAQLVIKDNSSITAPGATINYTGIMTDSIRGCLEWSPGIGDTGWHFIHITVTDSLCLPPGIMTPNTFTLPVHVSVVTHITGDTVVCTGESTRLHAGAGNRFEWSVWQGDPGSLSCTLCTDPLVTPAITTSYIVQRLDLPDIYCRDRDTFTVRVDPGPPFDAGPDLVKCRKDTLQLSLDLNGRNPADFSYEWTPIDGLSDPAIHNPLAWDTVSRTYRIRLRQKDGSICPAYDSIRVAIVPLPEILAPDGVCMNEPAPFRNMDTSTPGQRWLFGDGSTSEEREPAHVYTAPGTYIVQLISIPCGDTVSKEIHVDSIPFVYFRTDKDSLCAGDRVRFTPFYRSGADTLLWHFATGSGPHLSAEMIHHAFDEPGSYPVVLTAKYPYCPDTSYTHTIQVFPYPVVDLGEDTSLCPGEQAITLYNRQPESPGIRRWSTGATGSSMLAETAGTYWLELSAHGCTTTDSLLIKPYCHIGVPNAFSPNGDGVNDYFFPRDLLSAGLIQFRMQIFNRWGQLIFETTHTGGRGWDGKFNNAEQPQGVYVYLLEGTFRNGHSVRYQGNVTLFR